jgi:hypothetical protein
MTIISYINSLHLLPFPFLKGALINKRPKRRRSQNEKETPKVTKRRWGEEAPSAFASRKLGAGQSQPTEGPDQREKG